MHGKIEFLKEKADNHLKYLNDPNISRKYKYECKFHYMMQNPSDGVVTFDKTSRETFQFLNSDNLSAYFDEKGDFLCKPFNKLQITGVCLRGYNYGFGNHSPDRSQYICGLIAKNPKIKIIDLSNTALGDKEARQLITALKTNTYLQELILTGNPISQDNLQLIENQLVLNQRKVAKQCLYPFAICIGQAHRTQTGVLQNELLLTILNYLHISTKVTTKQKLTFACSFFAKPTLTIENTNQKPVIPPQDCAIDEPCGNSFYSL